MTTTPFSRSIKLINPQSLFRADSTRTGYNQAMSTNGHELNARQGAFVREYGKDHNATQAAVRAGYSKKTARQAGSRLLTLSSIKSALRARGAAALAKMEVTEDMVLQELAAIAFSNIEDYVEWDKDAGALVVKSSAEIPRHLAAAIQDIDEQVLISSNKDGSRIYERTKRKVKLHSKLEALKLLAEYLGVTESMAPKVTVYLKTGINRELPEPPAITVEAEPER